MLTPAWLEKALAEIDPQIVGAENLFRGSKIDSRTLTALQAHMQDILCKADLSSDFEASIERDETDSSRIWVVLLAKSAAAIAWVGSPAGRAWERTHSYGFF